MAARDIWLLVFTLFGTSWVMPKNVVQMLGCWQGRFHHHRISGAWDVAPLCIMWTIWREPNNKMFDGVNVQTMSSNNPC
jgi:hypothetical protein